MIPFFSENFGNPHSNNHEFGIMANNVVEEARGNVANLINAQKSEIIFTSGATESNNFAIKSIANNFFEKDGFTSVKHQREVGAGYFDTISTIISGGDASTLALEGSTEEEQF